MRAALTVAGGGSAAVAALHVAVAALDLAGASGDLYRFLGAGEALAGPADAGSPLPAVTSLAMAAVFAVFAAYAWAGAGRLRPPPFLRGGVLAIGLIYAARGAAVVPQTLALVRGARDTPAIAPQEPVISAVALAIGLLHLVPALRWWHALGARAREEPPAPVVFLAVGLAAALASGAGCAPASPRPDDPTCAELAAAAGEPAYRPLVQAPIRVPPEPEGRPSFEAVVLVRVALEPGGAVRTAELVCASHERYAGPVLESVRQWYFEPPGRADAWTLVRVTIGVHPDPAPVPPAPSR